MKSGNRALQNPVRDRYLAYVRWSEDDNAYIGCCPDLFPFGGVCHDDSPVGAFERLIAIVDAYVEDCQQTGRPLPPPRTRPMREVDLAA